MSGMQRPANDVTQIPWHTHALASSKHPQPRPMAADRLRLVYWETTSGCNLECVHCRRANVATELARQDMTTEQGMRFIDSLAECVKPILVFSGGEPLYRKDIFVLAKHARSCGLNTELATNGTLIGRQAA